MYTLVLLLGGNGSRMMKSIPKQYLVLAGKPVIMHTLERINKVENSSDVVIVCTEQYTSLIKEMLKRYNITVPVKFAKAGITRHDSVRAGLELVFSEQVILHEAARPFVSEMDFRTLKKEPCENAIYGSLIPFTVIKGHSGVEENIRRFDKELYRNRIDKFQKGMGDLKMERLARGWRR